MPVPTEVLNEDIKDVRDSCRKLASEMAEVRTDLRWIKAAGGAIIGILLSGAAGAIWNASALKSDVQHQGIQIEELRAEMKQAGAETRQQFNQMIQRLDHGLSQLPAELNPPSAKPRKRAAARRETMLHRPTGLRQTGTAAELKAAKIQHPFRDFVVSGFRDRMVIHPKRFASQPRRSR